MSSLRLPSRPLGRTGLHVSSLGLAAGAMRSRGPAHLTADEVERAFHEHGINTFLAYPRFKELCEGVRRLIRAGHRDELVLISEVGIPFAGSVRRGLESHLRSLGTDRVDVWLIGWVRKSWYTRDAVWSEMVRLRESGKTRAIGFSSHDRPLAAALAMELPADVLMVRYNAAHRGAERETFAPLAKLGSERLGIIAYTATRWGMLLRPVPQAGFDRGMSGGECYRFVLENPFVDMTWCAARSRDELQEDVSAVLAGPLEPQRKEEICRFGDAVHRYARHGDKWMFGATSS